MKKILFSASTYGHLKNFHQPYLKWFHEHNFDVHIAAGGDKRKLQFIDAEHFLPLEKNIFSVRNFLLAWRLSGIIRREGYDIVSVHTGLAAFFTRLAIILSGTRPRLTVYTAHGLLFDNKTNPIKKAILLGAEKITARVTDFVMTMNRQDTVIVQKYHLSRGGIAQIDGMGVDFLRIQDAMQKDRAQMRKALDLAENDFVMVYAADFSVRKNQSMLIRALDRLPQNVVLLLLGKGGTLESCQKLAQGKRVIFAGHVANVGEYYGAADICVSSSRIEGLPFNIMEAMSCALPIVASNVKGHEDLVQDGITGFLYNFDDEATFCQAVDRLIRDKGLRQRMGEASLENVKKYGIDAVLPTVIGLYEKAWESTTGEKIGI